VRWLAWALLVGLPATAQDEETVPPTEEAPIVPREAAAPEATDAPIRIERRLSFQEIETSLRDLASAHPDLVRVDAIGRSAGGRPLHVARITDLASGEPEGKPAVLLLAQDGGYESHGGELGTLVARRLVERARSDAAFGQLLTQVTFYVAPSIDPDQRDPSVEVEQAVRLDRNFPIGWRPGSIQPGGGAFPLQRPESRALVEFLADHPNVALLVTSTSVDTAGDPGPTPQESEDLETFHRLARGPEVASRLTWTPWSEATPVAGGLLDHAFRALGIFSVQVGEPGFLLDGEELSSWLDEAARGVMELGTWIPRLAIEVEAVERIGAELWQVDLRLENEGRLPTVSHLGSRRAAVVPLEVYLRGPEILATARRNAGSAAFEVAEFGKGSGVLREEPLDPGERRWLRVLLLGNDGDEIEVEATSPRAAGRLLRIPLP